MMLLPRLVNGLDDMCDDEFKRIIIKRGTGEPTIPVSADHRNNDWLVTDLYEGEFYEDTVTGILYYRSSDGIYVVSNPDADPENIYTINGAINETRVVTIDTTSGTLLIDAISGGTPLPPNLGDGLMVTTEEQDAIKGLAIGAGTAVKGLANTGTGGDFTSDTGNAIVATANDGVAIFAESQTDIGSTITGRLMLNMFGDGSTLHPSALLDLYSTTHGFGLPAMTDAQMNAIPSPRIGLKVYVTDALEGEYVYKSTGWTFIG